MRSKVSHTILGNHDAAVAGRMDYSYYYHAARHALSRLRGGKDEGEIVLAAAVVAITAAEFTGTLFFAGAGFTGFWLAAAVGLLAVRPPAEESLTARESLR